MCGIVGACAQRDVAPILIEGLKCLEYRGYDSAGLAVIGERGLERLRTAGKVRDLEAVYREQPVAGRTGIAHTRWATHGAPSTNNAHPHVSGERVAVVHNGIIENHDPIKQSLIERGYEFTSDTDTEVIAHLIADCWRDGRSFVEALQAAVRRLQGAYAIAASSVDEPDRVVAARLGSPLVAGVGIGEHFVASDIHALLPVTNRFIHLEEGDVVEISAGHCAVYDTDGHRVQREIRETELTADAVERGDYRHYMLKEIHEQPAAVARTIEGRISGDHLLSEMFGPKARDILPRVEALQIVACGTSYHAGLVARYWAEALAGIPCRVEVASELRYRRSVVSPGTLLVTISQSGETADTLAAMREARGQDYLASLAICNVPESSMVREADLVLMTRAGPEIGVASTKAFTTQLTALLMLVLELARERGLAQERYKDAVGQLSRLPEALETVLGLDERIAALAERFVDKHHALFLGRGEHYPIALEGALKLKEISYIHAEAYPAGELKHGPLALVDDRMPVVAVAPNDRLLEKLKSNMAEVRARGGELYVVADRAVAEGLDNGDDHLLAVPSAGDLLAPVLFTLPLQLLAYHVAVAKGTDVDQPRNLAKSVTVE